ncbi:hypothetical protein [Bradyrhizobium sp.]|uniref:hypothetical protein n=1 Tax=Bradyrhizobium sp. TaxID=376 RepID=UPI0039E47E0C
MREFFRPFVATPKLACLAFALTLGSAQIALAQAPKPAADQAAQAPALKQIALTEKQIEAVLAAKKDFDALAQKMPDNAAPDEKGLAQLDAAAKKNGFADYAEYATVADNIGLVLAGIDPSTKKYVGAEAVLKARIAAIQADKKMPADDKKEALAELNGALKSAPPAVTIKGNIDLVSKYYDKLAEAMVDDTD